MKKLSERLIPTEEKNCFKDPITGALVFKQPQREKKIDEVIKEFPEMKEKISNIDDKLNMILEIISNK